MTAVDGLARGDARESFNFEEIARVAADSLAEIASPRLRHLYQWWSSFAPALPRRGDFDIAQHWSIAANIFLVEVEAPGSFVVRVRGEEANRIVGDSTRNLPIRADGTQDFERDTAAYYQRIVEERRAMRCHGSLEFDDRAFANFESIDCPLIGDGDTVRFIVGAMDTEGRSTR